MIFDSKLKCLNDFNIRIPHINAVSPDDLALLDGNNALCSESSCVHTFSAGLDVASLKVGGDLKLGAGNTVFDVDVPELESSRVSLSQPQTLDGHYHFTTLNVGINGFTGDILYEYEGRNQSLYDMCDKLLLSTSTAPQTFTKARAFSQLSATTSVTTGTSGSTDSVHVGENSFDLKYIYDSSFQLDKDNTITSSDFHIQNEIKVSKNVEVTGTVETVDILGLATDLVLDTDADLVVTAPNGTTLTVSSNSQLVSVPGKKTFSNTLTITQNISTSGHLVVTAGGSDLDFTSGDASTVIKSRILKKNGEALTVSTNIALNGSVHIDGDIYADTIDGISLSSIIAKYAYDANNLVHELKTKFNFSGAAITVSDLVTSSVRGRDWIGFLGDILPKHCTGDVSLTVGDVTEVFKFTGEMENLR